MRIVYWKQGKMLQNLSTAADVIGALRVKGVLPEACRKCSDNQTISMFTVCWVLVGTEF